MADFAYLDKSTAHCSGFTCPSDRDACRRFTERNLGSPYKYWTSGNRAGDNGACTQRIWPVHLGQGVENVNPAGAPDER